MSRFLKLPGLIVVGLIVALAAGALAFWTVDTTMPGASAASGEVVLLSTTEGPGLADAFTAAGKTVVTKTPAEWAAMTAADFDAFDAIVLGDPNCVVGTGPVAAAEANAATWSSVVDGNVIVIGTDEVFHLSQGGQALMNSAAAFVVDEAGKTGAYISLSCYYHDVDPPVSPVPVLSGFGTFTVTGVGCFNDAHIVATHPALAGLTDATLSNWSCSVHEAFTEWPLTFEVLAIAEGIGAFFTAPDGSVGTPYILARGVQVISDISLAPESAINPIGTAHTLTATVITEGEPVVGTEVTFSVIDGPHAGTTGTGATDASGVATFAYTGTTLGTDTIEATFVDAEERTQRSNRVTKDWVEATPEPSPTAEPTTEPTPTPTAVAEEVQAPAALPDTGSQPMEDGSGYAWLAALAGAVALMGVGLGLAYARRRVR